MNDIVNFFRKLLKKCVFLFSRADAIYLHLDYAWICSRTLHVSGWAFSKAGTFGIEHIEIYWNDILLGTAIHGNIRTDVGAAYPFVTGSQYSGFDFRSELSTNIEGPVDTEGQILVNALSKNGRSQKLSIRCEQLTLIEQHSTITKTLNPSPQPAAPSPPKLPSEAITREERGRNKRRKLNILFIMYADFKNNSAIQVHNFANALIERGHQCIVAVPKNKKTAGIYAGSAPQYVPMTYAESLHVKELFPKKNSPDIIHAWTPREIVREHCLALKQKFPTSKIVIHLEDNEEYLQESHTGLPIEKLERLREEDLRKILPKEMSHPRRHKAFLEDADGITVIMDTLLEFAPNGKAHHVLWPIIDLERFFFPEKDRELKKKLKLKDSDFVIVYTGNVHAANACEVRELYLAVKYANEQGISCKLIRTGKDYYHFLGNAERWRTHYCIELGFIEGELIPPLFSLADLLIQPGSSDTFNDYRLPSKIPEFLAAGKPVALPATNIGRFLMHEQDALLLQRGDAPEILSIIQRLHRKEKLDQILPSGGREFARKHFNKARIVDSLERFYYNVE